MKKPVLQFVLGKAAVAREGFLVCAVFAANAAGQGLPSVPGLTAVQQPTAVNIQDTCIALNGLGGNPPIALPNPNGTPAERLSNSCSKMVVTAFANQGQSVPDQFNLKISNAQLATGTQAIAPVQMNAQKQLGIEAAKTNQIGARLLDLRGGARGFVLGFDGTGAQANNKPAGVALNGATGGGAAADDALGGGPWGGFLNVAYSWGNVDQTDLQDPYRYGSFNVLAGADYRVSDSLVLGAAIGYSDTHSDYEQSLGNVKARTTSVLGYGTYYSANWYVDGFLSYGSVNYDSTRVIFVPSNNPAVLPINSTATASPKGDQWSASIGVGANYPMATATVTPSLRLGYIWVKNKAFTEDEPVDGLGLAVEERTIRSLQTALAVKVSTNVNTSVGVFGPYFSAAWMHEFENDKPSIISRYVSDPTSTFFAIPTASPTSDYAVLLAGSTATFPNNFSAFLQLSAALGLKDASNYGVVLGIRKQF